MMMQDYTPERGGGGGEGPAGGAGTPTEALTSVLLGQVAGTSRPPGESGLCTEASNPRGPQFLSVALGETAVLRKPRGSAVFLGSRRM